MMPAALIGVAAAVGGAAISASATDSAAQTAANTAAANNALQKQIYDQNSANAQPYLQAGAKAATELQNFLGLGSDPAAAKAALQAYLNSTGYQFTQDQALDQVAQQKAAAGLLDSGGTLTALQDRAASLANAFGQQYEQNLQALTNTGQSAQGSLAGQSQSYANAVGANNNAAAQAAQSAATSNANTINALIGTAANAFNTARGASSFDAVSAPNSLNMIGG